jgi:hypothetical protein
MEDDAPYCGARTRHGCPCRKWPMTGRKRCRLHGGCATGPKTPEGRARIAQARTKHGGRAKAMQELMRSLRKLHADTKALLET